MIRRSRRRGFTLLEMSAVMWVYGILLLLGGAVVVSTLRLHQTTSAHQDLLSRRAAFIEKFRADAARSRSVSQEFGKWTVSPKVLILETSDDGHVVYESTAASVVRTEIHGENQITTPFPMVEGVRIEFEQPAAESRLIEFQFFDARTHGPIRRTDVSAALAGGRR